MIKEQKVLKHAWDYREHRNPNGLTCLWCGIHSNSIGVDWDDECPERKQPEQNIQCKECGRSCNCHKK